MAVNITKLTDAIGAEVAGVDLSAPIDDETIAKIREAWTRHGIVLFRGQSITLPQQIAFTKRFGDLYVDLSDDFTHPDHREVFVLSNIKQEGKYIGLPPEQTGEAWHSDLIYREAPAAGAFFYAKEAPAEAGDTLFAGMYAAYDALPQDRREQIDQLKCRYSRTKVYQLGILAKGLPPLSDEEKAALPDVVHPIVRTHPETGRKALYVGMRVSEATQILDMPEEEGPALLDDLRAFATQPQFVYRHHWSAGDAIMWDNRCTMHRASVFDPALGRRLCYRTMIAGDRPY